MSEAMSFTFTSPNMGGYSYNVMDYDVLSPLNNGCDK
jgi:hypothetical protein